MRRPLTRSITRPIISPLMRALTALGVGGFFVGSLFTASEQGVWYDPSDMSTLSQDSAGAVPVTAVGQPVGLMLDKRLGLGGVETITAAADREFSSNTGFWTLASGWTISGGKLVATALAAFAATQRLALVQAGKYYRVTVSAVVTAGTLNVEVGGATRAITVSGDYTFLMASTGTAVYITTYSAFTGTVDDLSIKLLDGNHATQATTAAKPVLQQDANGKLHLVFDGVDDFLQTGSIDFTATDKMSVFAGVRSVSGTGLQMLAELSANSDSNAGTFRFDRNGAIADSYLGQVAGVGVRKVWHTAASYPLNQSDVITMGFGFASGGSVSPIRVDAVTITPTKLVDDVVPAQNFGNFPVFIGRRGGTVGPFSGNLYGLTIRGAASTDAQIAGTERYLATKSGVVL